jgi:ribosomal protein L25 (general stress protein Ctc)
MNKVALSGTARKEIGTKYAAQLRREKRVPCVLYGGKETVHFSVEESALNKLVFTPELNGVEFDLDGKEDPCLGSREAIPSPNGSRDPRGFRGIGREEGGRPLLY